MCSRNLKSQVNRFQEIQEPEQKTEKPETADAQGMSNDMILEPYEQGLSKVEIAKQLGRGRWRSEFSDRIV